MNLQELIQATSRYGTDEYDKFIEDYLDEIYEMDDTNAEFELYKRLYIASKGWATVRLENELIELFDSACMPNSEYKNIQQLFNDSDTITVYRGINGRNRKNGHSYTTSKEKAEWFANRYKSLNDIGYVIEKTVTIDDIVFYDNSRNEQEVFVR